MNELQLQPGTRLAERFRLIRKIGRGGMGVVYEAYDEKLDRRVALKCATGGHQYRLPPEARAAREVSHFNVCKVHELHTAETTAGAVDFLSMEYIEGETLSARIRPQGPLREKEAREIALQICAGLAQAHRQGVSHGDLKCGNVMLAVSPEGGLRAVIMDFGLATMIASSEPSPGGTEEYMAPELFLGERATVKTDLYALGVIFHIMLTGHPPARLSPLPTARVPAWTADSQESTRTVDHQIPAALWARKLDHLSGPWGGLIARCLAPDPRKRFDSVPEVIRQLQPKTTRRVLLAGAAMAAAAFGYVQWQNSLPTGPPVRLAVLPFSVEGESAANINGIGVDIANRLSGARRQFVVFSPRDAERSGADTPEKARTILGATHVLEARLRTLPAGIHLTAWVSDLSSNRRIRELNGDYQAQDTAGVARALLATVTGAFQLKSGAPRETVSPAAYPPYVQGMDLLRQDNSRARDAIPLLEKAVALDQRSALPYAGLGEAQIQRFMNGDGAEWLNQASLSAGKAKSINPDAAPVLLVSGFLAQQHGLYESAISDYTRATVLDPENSEAWRRLAVVYESASRLEDAATTYRRAIGIQPNYYRHFLDFGNFYYRRGDFAQAESLYTQVIGLAPRLAVGHMNLGLALLQQGRFKEAVTSLQTARDLNNSPQVLVNLGAAYYAEENFKEAAETFESSLRAGPPSAQRYRDLGDAYRQLGQKEKALAVYRKGFALAQAGVARNPKDGAGRALLGLLASRLGDRDRAQAELPQALSIEPDNTIVLRESVIAYEALRQRERSISLLAKAPPKLIEELSRQPDVKDLQRDPRFQALLRPGTER